MGVSLSSICQLNFNMVMCSAINMAFLQVQNGPKRKGKTKMLSEQEKTQDHTTTKEETNSTE